MEAEQPEQGYHPNQTEPSGLCCFLQQERVCGADCMAFLPQPPQGVHYQGEQWAHCQLLVNADRVGRHLVIITQQLGQLKGEQLRQSRNQPPPTPK